MTHDKPVHTMQVYQVLKRVDWAQLAQQKLALLQAIQANVVVGEPHILNGLLHFIDAVQDAAENDGYKVVWLTDEEAEDCDV